MRACVCVRVHITVATTPATHIGLGSSSVSDIGKDSIAVSDFSLGRTTHKALPFSGNCLLSYFLKSKLRRLRYVQQQYNAI